jgi:DeoR family transcriptional regulator, fructose operon transcriptional repressor
MRASGARRQAILDLVGGGEANVEDLSRQFGVSPSTIRRDLAWLSSSGRVTRTYGGATLAPTAREESLREREGLHPRRKEAIARLAATLVGEDETIILDAGTTVGALARHLAECEGLRVVTNGLTALAALADAQGVEVTVLGGRLRHISLGLVGPLAEMALRRMTVDKAFLGADGVVAGRGLCENRQEQAALKELMARQAGAVYVLADSSKLGRERPGAWAPLDRPWTLVTDAEATADQLALFRDAPGVTVMVADLSDNG